MGNDILEWIHGASNEQGVHQSQLAESSIVEPGFTLSTDLEFQLRRQGKLPLADPIILAKLILESGEPLFLIDMHEEPYGTAVTCYDPSFLWGYSVILLRPLLATAHLCDNFMPVRTSTIEEKYGYLHMEL